MFGDTADVFLEGLAESVAAQQVSGVQDCQNNCITARNKSQDFLRINAERMKCDKEAKSKSERDACTKAWSAGLRPLGVQMNLCRKDCSRKAAQQKKDANKAKAYEAQKQRRAAKGMKDYDDGLGYADDYGLDGFDGLDAIDSGISLGTLAIIGVAAWLLLKK
jgi:hypothetical protein